jgi:acyl-CoA thioesterase
MCCEAVSSEIGAHHTGSLGEDVPMGNGWTDLELIPVDGGSGRFTTTISDPWMLVVVPQGGIVGAIAARAMALTLGRPDQTLRSLSAVFAGQVGCGPVEVDVAVLRTGRSMSQLTATVRNPGSSAGRTAIAVFGSARRGFDFTDLSFPDVPGPEGLPSFRDPVPEGIDFESTRPPMRFWDEVVEARPAIGRAPWDPYEPGPAVRVYWYRIDDPPLTPDGHLDPLAALVVCDTMPGAVSEKADSGGEPWFGPSADLTVHFFGPARPGWLLAHNQARHAGDGYASVDMALWDPTGPTLVAYATQIMFFAFGV